MTVTTTTLGSNSAEIVVYNEPRYSGLMTAIDTFVTNHGWTAKAGVGNDLEKVYTSANAAGGGTKEIKINAIDLHIQHADSFTGTTTVTATNEAVRWVHNEYLRYPENLWTSTGGTGSFNGSLSNESISVSLAVINYGYWEISANSQTLTLPSGLAETLYPGQFIRLVSQNRPNEVYVDALVVSHNNVTGVVDIDLFNCGPDEDETETQWYLLAHCMAYNTKTNPAYVYISASSKHIAIQCRNTQGIWHDFHAVCETENPLAVADASILTTGYMLGNSGYVQYDATSNIVNSSSRATFDRSPFRLDPEINNQSNRLRIWTGPCSMPSTRKNRTGLNAARFTAIHTPIGSAEGCIGSEHMILPDDHENDYGTAYDAARFWTYHNRIYYRGMGDVIPNDFEPVTGKHWALSGSLVCDISDSTFMTGYSPNNFSLDTWCGGVIKRDQDGTLTLNTGQTYEVLDVGQARSTVLTSFWQYNQYNSQTNDWSWSTQEPTLLGRIYNIKFVTTGLKPTNILSIKVDANGFVDDSGSAADHLVFSYVSDYKKDLRGGSTGLVFSDEEPTEIANDSEMIKQSQSVAVAFPK